MSKLIRIPEKMKRDAQAEFARRLADMKMAEGSVSYVKAFRREDASAVLWLTALAYRKTQALVAAFPGEVAWHATASRRGPNEFVIEDIHVYPQEVTGGSVHTDQERYTQWLYSFDDGTFSRIRMHGHSHAHMGVTPSGVDINHREKLLNQLDTDMFYIFMIWNKRLETHTLIYDMPNNILYENGDITVKVAGDDDLEPFLTDAREKAKGKKKVYRVKRSGTAAQAMYDPCSPYGEAAE